MEIRVIRPGSLTTVQDLGRPGQRAMGLSQGGAVDAFALRLANRLVGNAENAPGLEMSMVGAELEFSHAGLVAVTGADMGGVELARPHVVAAGERIKFEAARTGCRAYLAVAGGVDAPKVLGGRGTDLRAGLGGWSGRALRAGDVLPIKTVERSVRGRWRIDPQFLVTNGSPAILRALPGTHAGEFVEDLVALEFTVSPQSDRMGVRLTGSALHRRTKRELISSGVAPGTVQVPPGGDPIVLMADAQTIGGYPRLAHVISVDFSRLAQLRPGDRVRFEPVTLAVARQLHLEREKSLGLLVQGLKSKLQ